MKIGTVLLFLTIMPESGSHLFLQTSILRLNHATQALIYSGCYQRKIFQHKNVTTVDEKNGIAFNGIVLW